MLQGLSRMCGLLIMITVSISAHDGYTFKLHRGKELPETFQFIAEQSLIIYQEYPYLYLGTMTDYLNYLEFIASDNKSVAVVAYYQDKPVGFLTGASFVHFSEHFKGSKELFDANGLDSEKCFYITDVIVIPEHRDRGLTKRMMNLVESYALQNNYSKSCFVCEIHKVHQSKPINYRELNDLWRKLGYTSTNLVFTLGWPTIQPDGHVEQQNHPLTYWIKDLI